MDPDQAARIIQKAWFEWKSWCLVQNAVYNRDTPIPHDYCNYYEDEEIEYFFY
jgi:hypothetical protein